MLTLLSFGKMHLVGRSFGVAVVLVACQSWARPDINAFLNQRATTVRSLVEQVKRDPEVMDRYRRHFSMSRSQLIGYLSSLHPSRTVKEEVLAIYSVPPDGHIKMRHAKVKAGTAVFRDMAGNAILIAKCGNPLDRGPRDPLAKNDEPMLAERTPEELREFSPEVSLPHSDELLALAPATPESPAEIITKANSPVTILPAAFGFNPLLLGLGLPFLFDNGNDDETIVIPEPATLSVITVGLIAIAARRRRTR